MITKWKVFNFKSIQKETELDLKPLTIFAGANSSGKSTLIQSILLIAQTLSSKIESKSVVLNGLYTKLGQFDDVRSYGSEVDQVLIGWKCEHIGYENVAINRINRLQPLHTYDIGEYHLKTVSCEVFFDVKGMSPTYELSQLQPSLFSCFLSSSYLTDDKSESKSELSINRGDFVRGELEIEDDSIERESFNFDVTMNEESLTEIHERFASAEPIGCTLSHFLPRTLTIKYKLAEEEARQITSILCERRLHYPQLRYGSRKTLIIPKSVLDLLKARLGEIGRFIDEIRPIQPSLFPEILDITVLDWLETVRNLPASDRRELLRILDDDEVSSEVYRAVVDSREEKYSVITTRFPREIMRPAFYLNSFFSNQIKYLGPLRDEPRPLYPLIPNVDPSDIGLKGEYTAAVLNNHKNIQTRYIPSNYINKIPIVAKLSIRSLESAVIDWLRYLDIAETVETHDRGKHGHEMKVTTSGTDTPQDLPHVGVGVSQVLPILVMCLLAEKDTTLIIEQPELHLHPLVQTRLADFFISMALLGKQCIIETHSEYLINRLRLRIASDLEDGLSSLSKIYFSEKNESGHSSFREVTVNEYGAISDWPEGFFDQSQFESEEILRAAAQKRKSRRKGQKNAKRNN